MTRTTVDGQFYLDSSKRALLALEGPDGLDLLQRISTNNLAKLGIGEHVRTVLTNEKGRIVDLLSVARTGVNSLLLAGESDDGDRLKNWIEKFIVMEDAQISMASNRLTQILMFNLTLNELIPLVEKHFSKQYHLMFQDSNSIRIAVESGIKENFFTFLRENEFKVATKQEYEFFRVMNGIPGVPNELSDEYNPLEAGLRSIVDFRKGCYVGQEVIARLDTYDKVRKRLQRLHLSLCPENAPTELRTPSGMKAGVLTSWVTNNAGQPAYLGLGVVAGDLDSAELRYTSSENGQEGKAGIKS